MTIVTRIPAASPALAYAQRKSSASYPLSFPQTIPVDATRAGRSAYSAVIQPRPLPLGAHGYVLVEAMGPRGLELMVGAKRDPLWGTVLLLGLGGIWVEALGDVQLLPGSAGEDQFAQPFGRLLIHLNP